MKTMHTIKTATIVVLMSLLALLGAPSSSFAQAKIRIAIWEFENHSDTANFFYDKAGPAARDQIDTQFSEDKTLSSKFSVVERDKLNLVLKEQNLGASGAVDPSTAAKVGRLLGVKYIVLGAVDKVAVNNTSGGIGAFGVGGNLVQANATINLRFIDTTTAERVISISADGEVKKGGGFFKGTNLSREDQFGIANEAIQKAALAVVAKLDTSDYLARITSASSGPLEGKIIKVDGNRAWINLGAQAGIKVGDAFNVINVGEALIDPDTGKKLGAEEQQTGAGSIVEVQPLFAVMNFTGKAAAKDTVRKK